MFDSLIVLYGFSSLVFGVWVLMFCLCDCLLDSAVFICVVEGFVFYWFSVVCLL